MATLAIVGGFNKSKCMDQCMVGTKNPGRCYREMAVSGGLIVITFVCFSGGLLTPIPTPTSVSPTGTQDASAKPQISKIPNPLPLPLVTTGTLTPDSSPLGVLSPAATTAAVSMAMNGAKRALSTSQAPTSNDEEPEIKRQKLLQQQSSTWHGSQPETAGQDKL